MKITEYPRLGERALREVMSNGLTVCIVPKPGFCKKYAVFATRYGGMDLRFCRGDKWFDTPAGIAHYLEHKMFDTADGNALKTLSQNGAEPNAFTANAMTAYYFDCTEHFDENLRILLSFVSVPYFTQESVDKERGIIAQEIRMVEDNPDWQVYEKLLECLYRNSPARTAIAGTVESIAAITPETLYDCHKAFYCPSNMILCVVGDVDPDAILQAVREILPSDRGETIARDYGEAEDGTVSCERSVLRMEVAQTQFLLGFQCDCASDGEALLRENVIGELACDLLLGESAPLYQKLYGEGLINSSFDSGFDQLPGIAYVYAGGESSDPDRVRDAIIQEAKRLCDEGIDEAFYNQIRKANFGASLRALNSFESIAVSVCDSHFRGYDFLRFPEVYDSVERSDVEDFLRRFLVRERCAVSIVEPKEKAK